ncbi:6408_t:CDS:2 [Ambispora gerdemannii]|uniref:6408_t:CDS:1 n=1 Tax=Ambispora gerdemannii TaxID=144530 RepID=A0A9N9CVI4_9GLOM|nr:6408_t:CDS:2 [Ambispora gerdemannii]
MPKIININELVALAKSLKFGDNGEIEEDTQLKMTIKEVKLIIPKSNEDERGFKHLEVRGSSDNHNDAFYYLISKLGEETEIPLKTIVSDKGEFFLGVNNSDEAIVDEFSKQRLDKLPIDLYPGKEGKGVFVGTTTWETFLDDKGSTLEFMKKWLQTNNSSELEKLNDFSQIEPSSNVNNEIARYIYFANGIAKGEKLEDKVRRKKMFQANNQEEAKQEWNKVWQKVMR